MKRNMLRRSALREIRSSLGRFLAILSIIALSVGFFAGVRCTTPSMRHAVNAFWENNRLFDYRLVSTIGWEDKDVKACAAQPDVMFAEGAQTLDVLCENKQGDEFVFKTHSITRTMNLLELTEGRMPHHANECIMDAGMELNLHIGDKLHVSTANDEDTIEALSYDTYTIVGAAHSSYYLNFERGSTSLGNGTVSGYLYLMPEAYDREVYSEIFVRFKDDAAIYSAAYNDAMDARQTPWEELTQKLADERYDRVIADAKQEIEDGRQELAEKRADGLKELRDAKKELDDGRQELADAEQKLADGKKELDDARSELDDGKQELEDNAKKISDAEQKLADAKKKLDDAEKQLSDAQVQIEDNSPQIEDGEAQLRAAKEQLDSSAAQLQSAADQLRESKKLLSDGQKQLSAASREISANESALLAQEQALTQQESALHAALANADMLPPEKVAELQGALAAVSQGRAQIDAGKQQIAAARQELAAKQAELDAGRSLLADGEKQYQQGMFAYQEGLTQYHAAKQKFESGKSQFDKGKRDYEKGKAEYEKGKADYEKALKELEDGKQKYADGVKAYEEGEQKYEDGLRDYEDGLKEYEDGRKEYEDGLKEYNDGKKEFDEKIADAEQELADAEEKLADLHKPDTYVLDRSTNTGYACFESDSEIVDQVAKVFPLLFIMVAGLVCMTTMSRMVEEQRTSIGTLKALGYSEGSIMRKFALYSASASVIGCVLGYAVGTVVFPNAIWMSYQLMYIPIHLDYVFNWKIALLTMSASVLLSVGTTWLSCRIELNTPAAGLMRPKAPKAGKRVLLEYVPFIWNRMKFLHKVSIRNIFRYKGRFFMMILGIGGCTALLLTGFGLKDTVADFAQVQYGEILVADAEMGFSNDLGGEIPDELLQTMDEVTEEYLLLRETSLDLVTKDHTKALNVIVPMQTEQFDHYMHLKTMDGQPLTMPGLNEAYVSNSVQDRFGVKLGDTITLRTEDMQEIHVKVSGIFENHVYNYVLMLPETLEQQLGEPVIVNAAYVNFPEGADVHQAQAELAKSDDVTMVLLFQELMERMNKMMESLNYIVFLVIVCAAGLAFIVVYNLTNINITERIREIATIKVLGFFKNETAAYVLRENIVLTAIGIAVGLVVGVFFHRFAISQIIVDLVSFKTQILPMSFVWSVLLTFGFNAFVSFVMGFKLEKINMAESLKSVD